MKEEWCEHITLFNDSYEIYDKYVPSSWSYCPICGKEKPGV